MADYRRRDYPSPSQGSPPRKAPYTDQDATGIHVDVLSRTPRGRQVGLEARLAMQRELDGTRSQMKAQEEAGGDLRRQMLQSREDAAIYRSENLRLQDELRSCKQRLNSALDEQDEVLRKNSEVLQQVHELKNREISSREELNSKIGLVDYYQEQNSALEAELQALIQRSQETEKALGDELSETLEALGQCRNELNARAAENDTLVAKNQQIAVQFDEKDNEIAQRDEQLAIAAQEREEVRNELQSSIVRLESVQTVQNELRSQIQRKSDDVSRKQDEIDSLISRLNEREKDLVKLSTDVASLTPKAEEAAVLRKTQEHLADLLAHRDHDIAQLRSENARLSVKAEEADTLRESRLQLADRLADAETSGARLQAETTRLAFEKENLRQSSATHERALEVELNASRAKERALLDQTASLHRFIGSRDTEIRRAEVDAARALRSYHAMRAEDAARDRLAITYLPRCKYTRY
eukprot:m.141436 g.141436  ORF g.141436 m.141436 type:complete len:469 (-) comp30189_c0_seq1:57-1463(-)